jgi:DNA processing protein
VQLVALNDIFMESNAAYYYNALAVALHGDRGALLKAWKKWGGWEAAWGTLGQSELFTGLEAREVPDAAREWETLDRSGTRLVLPEDSDYPALLHQMADPPFGIYIRGTLSVGKLTLAIVGTRRATPEGLRTAEEFGRVLGSAGLVIVSGLALGIDAAGHMGALGAGGIAVAVLAGGLSEIYPHTNTRLAEKILAADGAIISEYPLQEPPYQYRFIERNRIISGLSRGVLVVEAPAMSGSLATARFALEQNRDVFVVPGSIGHGNFKGSHALIRQGAELVTSPQDILDAYGIARDVANAKSEESASPAEKLILEALRKISAPADVDKIIEMTRLEPRIVASALSFLIVKDLIVETKSGYTMKP